MKYQKLKICLIYNGAPLYRAAIFKLLDDEYECDWYFARGVASIKQLPLSFFKNAHYLDAKPIKGALYRQSGEVKLLLSKEYDVFFILGEIVNVSCWCGMILHNIFNRRRKVYFWSHGMLRVRKNPRRFFDNLFFRLPYGSFVYGNCSRNNMIQQGINASRLFTIHNSLDHQSQLAQRANLVKSDIYKNYFGNDLPVIIFIGRLIREKQLSMILEADNIAKLQGKTFNVIFIGNGEDKIHLQELSEQYGLKINVWFFGACYEESKLSNLLFNADLCVSPGNIGLTAIHAMVYGCPVITHNNFGHHGPEYEAIHEGITGSFFKENDIQDLANKIITWLNNGFDRDEIRHNCYNEIDESWNPKYQIEIIKRYLKP